MSRSRAPSLPWSLRISPCFPPRQAYRAVALSLAAVLATAMMPATALADEALVEQRPTLHYPLRLDVVATGLAFPWSLAFLPDGRALVSERGGSLALIDNGQVTRLEGMPEVSARGQGGLFDLALHPDYGDGEHDWLYFSWARPAPDDDDREGDATALSRVWFDGNHLGDTEHLFTQNRFSRPGRHYGGRIAWLPDATLVLSIGDRGVDKSRAQDPGDHAGSLLHLTELGEPVSDPEGQPTFPDLPEADPALYSMGHRNPQGLAVAADGTLWSTEHGPRTGDELNRLLPGENYGWPEVTLGRDYVTNLPIGKESAPGMQDPVHVFEGRFAPSGLAVVQSELLPAWNGDLLAGGLRGERLVRLRLDGDTLVEREVVLNGEAGRLRDVRQGPDGGIYLLTDDDPGRLLRLSPTAND